MRPLRVPEAIAVRRSAVFPGARCGSALALRALAALPLAASSCAHATAMPGPATSSPPALAEPSPSTPPVEASADSPSRRDDETDALDDLEAQADQALERADFAEAARIAGEVVRRDARGHPYAHVVLGDVDAAAGRTERAIEQYAEALAIDPSDGWAATRTAEVLTGAGQAARARGFLGDFLERHHPSTPDAYDELGWLDLEEGDSHRARADFLGALQVSAQRDADAYYGLAVVAADASDAKGTADALIALLAVDPSRRAEVMADHAFDEVRSSPAVKRLFDPRGAP